MVEVTSTDKKEAAISVTPSSPAGLTLERKAHLLTYGLGCEGWVATVVIVLVQWFLVDKGHWNGLPSYLTICINGVVTYSALLDIVVNYSVDPLCCAQALIRLYVTFGIAYLFPPVQTQKVYYPLMLLVWSINYIVLYSYNICKAWFPTEKGINHKLVNARFSWFRFLYPISVGLEVMLAYTAIPLAKAWNKNYSLLMVLAAFAYVPSFPALFQNMWIERRKYIQRQFLEKNK